MNRQNDVFYLAEKLLELRAEAQKLESVDRNIEAAEKRLKELCTRESQVAADIAKSVQASTRKSEEITSAAKKSADSLVAEAQERAASIKSGTEAALSDARAEIDVLVATKKALTEDLAALRKDVVLLADQKAQLAAALAELRSRVARV